MSGETGSRPVPATARVVPANEFPTDWTLCEPDACLEASDQVEPGCGEDAPVPDR